MNNAHATAQHITGPSGAPKILLLGPVELIGADEQRVEPTRRRRLIELATIVALNPGCDHTVIDAHYYPGQRVGANTRNTQISKLRRWLGSTEQGQDYFPRHSSAGYRLAGVRTDWDDLIALVPLEDDITSRTIDELQEGLKMVRGRPFANSSARRYAWADRRKQQMIDHIIRIVIELARRHADAAEWRKAEAVIAAGLEIEPGLELLWRLRLHVLRRTRNLEELSETIARLRILATQWGIRLEPATEQLISAMESRSGHASES